MNFLIATTVTNKNILSKLEEAYDADYNKEDIQELREQTENNIFHNQKP